MVNMEVAPTEVNAPKEALSILLTVQAPAYTTRSLMGIARFAPLAITSGPVALAAKVPTPTPLHAPTVML
jgi:hypothetical protein